MGMEQFITARCCERSGAVTTQQKLLLSTGKPGHWGVSAGPKATRLPSAAPRGELPFSPTQQLFLRLRLPSFVSIPRSEALPG